MSKYFYSHLINIDSLALELEELEFSKDEKKELIELAHVHIHQMITDAILSELKEEDKRKFLELLAGGEDEKIWEHLNTKVEKIEDKIKAASEQVKKELTQDIKKIKLTNK